MKCLVTGCLNCSNSNGNICTTCNNTAGYYNNATTNKCSTKCGDGIYVSATEGCDDNNTDSYDGCSAGCGVESNFGCSGSPSVCYYASSVVVSVDSQHMESVVCNTITFGLRITPPSATFAQSYVNWTNFISTPNASILQQNHTMSTYTSGILSVSFFLLNHLQNTTLLF
jgi:cysteine-rich repeat protein